MVSLTVHVTYDICNLGKLKRVSGMLRKLAKGGEEKLPIDVPPGHLAVIVGQASKRFIIKADYLNHPVFKQLLDQAYEEYGRNKDGPLMIPCDEFLFQDIIHSLQAGTTAGRFLYHVDGDGPALSSWNDSRLLLHPLTRKSTH